MAHEKPQLNNKNDNKFNQKYACADKVNNKTTENATAHEPTLLKTLYPTCLTYLTH